MSDFTDQTSIQPVEPTEEERAQIMRAADSRGKRVAPAESVEQGAGDPGGRVAVSGERAAA